MNSRCMPKITVRLPPELKVWLTQQATRNASSQTSEVVRALRERMERNFPRDHDPEELLIT
jgi:Arc/MetJ-type ribon-helix-helix transcriptional regulator